MCRSILLFLGGAELIAALFAANQHDKAINLFMAILPVSSGIVAYWFATRKTA